MNKKNAEGGNIRAKEKIEKERMKKNEGRTPFKIGGGFKRSSFGFP